jgi:ankyrin repeat protein
LIGNELQDDLVHFTCYQPFSIKKTFLLLLRLCYLTMQDGSTPATEASYNGHTDTLSLLLLNKADLKAATEVRQLNKIFRYLKSIRDDLQDEDIDLPHKTLIVLNTFFFFCAQDGRTLAYLASQRGHTEALALLLSNNADVNTAANVQLTNRLAIICKFAFKLFIA